MSYHGSVYCGWCCTKGHNKRGCPERKEYIRANPDSYEARKQQGEEQRRKERGARKCSYCDTAGHNRKTCTFLRSDRQFIVAHYKERRSTIAEKLVQEGLGVGALVNVRDHYDGNTLATVTGFDWKDLNGNLLGDMDSSVNVSLLVQRFDETHVRWCSRALHLSEDNDVVASGIPPEVVRDGFPAGWLDGTHYKESRFFEKGETRHYFFCDNNPQDG